MHRKPTASQQASSKAKSKHTHARTKHASARCLTTTHSSSIRRQQQQPQQQQHITNISTPPIPFQSTTKVQITPHIIHSTSGFSTRVGLTHPSSDDNKNSSISMPKSTTRKSSSPPSSTFSTYTNPFKSTPSFSTTTTQYARGLNNSVVMVQDAHFFTGMAQKIKSAFTSTPTPTPTSTRPSTHTNESNYQMAFKDLPDVNKKHIESVMARFRTHLANRPKGADTPITASDKAEFIITVTPDELESLQCDQGSQHFFQLPQPTTRLSTLLTHPASTIDDNSVNGDKTQKEAPRLTKLDKNSPEYAEMMKNNNRRYHDGELNAKMELRRAQMIKDSLESDVFHLDVDDIIAKQAQRVEELQAKYENNPDFDLAALQREMDAANPTATPTSHKPTEIKMTQNQDGTISFQSSGQTTTGDPHAQPHHTGASQKVQVPVDGTPTQIGTVIDPRLLISFLCDVCSRRNVKSIPKNSYEKGVVLIRCECDADHLISDNLGWFDDSGSLRIDQIMRQDKGEEVFHASVLDAQKSIRDKMDMTLGPDEIGKEIGQNHITPEMLQKINEALAIAREQDERKKDQFKHFHQQDKAADELRRHYETMGQMPMLPPGKVNSEKH